MMAGEAMEKPIPYQAYLIRLWPTRRQGLAGCRVSLESVATGRQKNFPDLESLFAFLQGQAGEKGSSLGLEGEGEGGDTREKSNRGDQGCR
jgi:hypothetical protein